jgi:hypothetical protein
MKRFSSVENTATVNLGAIWSKNYASSDSNGSFVAQKVYVQWTTIDGIGDEPGAPGVNSFDWDPYYGFPVAKVISNTTIYVAEIDGSSFDVGVNYTWYKNSTHGGFFVAKRISTSNSFHATDQGYSAGWSADCPWLEAEGSTSSITHNLYYIHNELEFLLSECTLSYSGQTFTGFTGEYGSPLLLVCYKKENLSKNGIGETEDVTILSYFLGTVWNSYTKQVDTVTKTGYMMISSAGDLKKEFDSNSVGVHDLVTIDGVLLHGDGNFCVNTFAI